MNSKLREALYHFASLLPDYLPESLSHPNDYHRWLDVCIASCVTESQLSLEDIAEAIKQHHEDWSDKEIKETAQNCKNLYNCYSSLLDYLNSRNLLVLQK